MATCGSDFWQAKLRNDMRPKARPKSVPDFLDGWLKMQHGESHLKIAYNLMDAVERYASQDPECELFVKIVEGRLSEEVYHELQQMLQELVQACEDKERRSVTVDSVQYKSLKFILNRMAFVEVLTSYKYNRWKSEQEMLEH